MMLLLRWLSRRSLWFLHVLGSALGWTAWCLSPSYRARCRHNADLAGVSAADRRAAIGQAGRMTTELPRLWLRPGGAPVVDPVRWEGDGWLENTLAESTGVIVLTPHLGSFEVVGQAYAERFGARWPMTALYRPARKAWLRHLEETARARPAMATAPASIAGVRQLMRALRRGETVGMLPDQVPPDGMGVWATFFGQPAYTMTLAARLARQTGATMVVAWGERLDAGAGYVVRAQPLAHPVPAEADEVAAATAINLSMQAVIAQCPAQYLWGYHRYKAPRPGAAP